MRSPAAAAVRPQLLSRLNRSPERGLIMRVLLHSPKDTLAATAALAAVIAIVTNAMFLQAGRHPSRYSAQPQCRRCPLRLRLHRRRCRAFARQKPSRVLPRSRQSR
jgi:hypothetical protein